MRLDAFIFIPSLFFYVLCLYFVLSFPIPRIPQGHSERLAGGLLLLVCCSAYCSAELSCRECFSVCVCVHECMFVCQLARQEMRLPRLLLFRTVRGERAGKKQGVRTRGRVWPSPNKAIGAWSGMAFTTL